MWPFKKKQEQKESEPEIEKIAFRADDIAIKRAKNIWLSLGFVNDRFGAIPSIAGLLAMYRDWDREAAEQGVQYLDVESLEIDDPDSNRVDDLIKDEGK